MNDESDPSADELPLPSPEHLKAMKELYDTPLESYAETIPFATADQFFEFLRFHPLVDQNWAFRGHADKDWPVAPSLERLGDDYHLKSEAEEYVRLAFKRRAHYYLSVLPEENEELEWLALMRHHGTPTRLLDWTRSPYVAAFFATADAKRDSTSAIWAIDIEAVKREAIQILTDAETIDAKEPGFSFSQPDVFNKTIIRGSSPAVVVPVQPFKMNERVTSQQGLFLCTNSTHAGFEFGLKQVLKSDRDRWTQLTAEMFPNDDPSEHPAPSRLFKLLIRPEARTGILRELHRMNINYATLFPGLDGFSRSLGTVLTISEPFNLLKTDIDSKI